MDGDSMNAGARLTRSQMQILGRISVATTLWGGMQQTKRGMAEEQGLSEVTVDRAIRRLRELGLIEVDERWHECGSQDANFYRAPADAAAPCEPPREPRMR